MIFFLFFSIIAVNRGAHVLQFFLLYICDIQYWLLEENLYNLEDEM